MKKKKLFVFAHLLILGLIFLSSCKKKVTICSIFNETAYSVNDTIIADASCSEKRGRILMGTTGGVNDDWQWKYSDGKFHCPASFRNSVKINKSKYLEF